jgi:hypothetical protein
MLTMTEGTSDNQHWFATALARYVQRRRAQLRLKPARAAEPSGVTLQEWESIETGLVPAEDKLVRIADVLRADCSKFEMLALCRSKLRRADGGVESSHSAEDYSRGLFPRCLHNLVNKVSPKRF